MAAPLQQSPIAFYSKIIPTARSASSLSFASGFTGVRLPSKTRLGAPSTAKTRRGGARMSVTPASSYASALADAAEKNGTLEATAGDMEKVNNIFSEEQVFDFFINPTIDLEKKQSVLEEIISSNQLQPYTGNFLNILLDNGRVEIVKEIVKEFELAFNKTTNTEVAVVTSVVKLDAQHLAQIAQGVQKLTGAKNVRIKTVIDESLVAGFTIRYGFTGSKIIDMSVKKQLDEIASQLDFSDMVGSLA